MEMWMFILLFVVCYLVTVIISYAILTLAEAYQYFEKYNGSFFKVIFDCDGNDYCEIDGWGVALIPLANIPISIVLLLKYYLKIVLRDNGAFGKLILKTIFNKKYIRDRVINEV